MTMLVLIIREQCESLFDILLTECDQTYSNNNIPGHTNSLKIRNT